MFGVLRLVSTNMSEVVYFVTCFEHSFHSCSDTIHHSAVIVCILVGFLDRVSLCRLGQTLTHKDSPVSVSHVLELKMNVTTSGYIISFHVNFHI